MQYFSNTVQFAFRLDPGVVRPACRWLRWLLAFWLDSFTNGERQSDKEHQLALLGGEAARHIAEFSLRLCSERRRALANDAEFKQRSLDPPRAARPRARAARATQPRLLRTAVAQLKQRRALKKKAASRRLRK